MYLLHMNPTRRPDEPRSTWANSAPTVCHEQMNTGDPCGEPTLLRGSHMKDQTVGAASREWGVIVRVWKEMLLLRANPDSWQARWS